jgi:hypothetical protein
MNIGAAGELYNLSKNGETEQVDFASARTNRIEYFIEVSAPLIQSIIDQMRAFDLKEGDTAKMREFLVKYAQQTAKVDFPPGWVMMERPYHSTHHSLGTASFALEWLKECQELTGISLLSRVEYLAMIIASCIHDHSQDMKCSPKPVYVTLPRFYGLNEANQTQNMIYTFMESQKEDGVGVSEQNSLEFGKSLAPQIGQLFHLDNNETSQIKEILEEAIANTQVEFSAGRIQHHLVSENTSLTGILLPVFDLITLYVKRPVETSTRYFLESILIPTLKTQDLLNPGQTFENHKFQEFPKNTMVLIVQLTRNFSQTQAATVNGFLLNWREKYSKLLLAKFKSQANPTWEEFRSFQLLLKNYEIALEEAVLMQESVYKTRIRYYIEPFLQAETETQARAIFADLMKHIAVSVGHSKDIQLSPNIAMRTPQAVVA